MSRRQCVRIREVGPRDGFQNEPETIPTAAKVETIDALARTGLTWIEVTSFVHPKWVPQLADAEAVCAGLPRRAGVAFAAFVPNAAGLDRARACGIVEATCALTASDALNVRNFNRDTATMLAQVIDLRERASVLGIRLGVTIGAAFGCPVEGDLPEGRTESLIEALVTAGYDEIGLGDTTGVANPRQVREMFTHLVSRWPSVSFIGHFHETRGTGLANAVAAFDAGVRRFDASVAGLGGCPFAPGALGNVSTEDLAHLFEEMGVDTGLDIDALIAVAKQLEGVLGRRLYGRVSRAGRVAHGGGEGASVAGSPGR
jgi:hydroxymethylglutaryl-CoA lyase